MKSQVNSLLHVASGILTDAKMAYPALEDSLSKDLDRLTLYCQKRGLSVFTLDLPALESLLLEALESGRLRLEGPLSQRVSKSTKVPRLFSGLWLRVFDRDACLKHEVDINSLFFLRCLLTLGKRIEVDPTFDRTQAKVGEYHDIERTLRKPSLAWQCDELVPSCGKREGLQTRTSGISFGSYGDCSLDQPYLFQEEEGRSTFYHDSTLGNDGKLDVQRLHLVQALDYQDPVSRDIHGLFYEEQSCMDIRDRELDFRLLNKIQQVADLIFGSFDEFDADYFSSFLYLHGEGSGFRHGPGAVAERLKNWEKSKFPNWSDKLQGQFPFELCGTTPDSEVGRPLNHEVAARLIAVPKTAKGPRLIAAEPTSHQWCQQLLLRFLFDQCRAHFGTHFIDFKDQQKSGSMVLDASRNLELATVDLSDASDRLTCWTVERIIRKNISLLKALHAARTRYVRDEISKHMDFLSLRKFASQGTATTFPVMSLVMLCISLGVTFEKDEAVNWASLRKRRFQVRVFGDDIIIPKTRYARLVRAMELLQLKVNKAKSYVNGHFRESCGVDGYMGYDITPVKPKTLVANSPAACQAVVDTSNNLFNKGLWYASRTAEDLIPTEVRQYLRIVGRNAAGLRGLSSFSGSDESHLRKRWNSRFHRDEVRVWSIQGQARREPREGVEGLLDFFARSFNPGNPRIVSEYLDVRKTKSRLLWEPENPDARTHD